MPDMDVTELAKSIPDKVWVSLVDTATQMVRQLFYPITATTEGVGKLIETKFSMLTDPERVLAAETINSAVSVIKKRNDSIDDNFKPKVIIDILQSSSVETDEYVRDIWARLLATELSEGTVHPEIPNVLRRMTSIDAKILKIIASDNYEISKSEYKKYSLFSFEILENLNLIHRDHETDLLKITLTNLGKAFWDIVRDQPLSNDEVMDNLNIEFDGLRYIHNGNRYENIEDAILQAKLLISKNNGWLLGMNLRSWNETQLMIK